MSPEEYPGLDTFPRSLAEQDGSWFFLVRDPQTGKKRLAIRGDGSEFAGPAEVSGRTRFYPLSSENASLLRHCLPWLRPNRLGLQSSFGFGDRLGRATPGHVQAVRDTGIAPIFAQQSVRENSRTGRSPQQVLDDALWGLFQEGWQQPWGADADHAKIPTDFDPFIAAGYTLYTIDPGEHVDNQAQEASPADVEARVHSLPWDNLETTFADMEKRYLNLPQPGTPTAHIDRAVLWRAAAKYGRAIAHTARMYRYLEEQAHHQFPELSFELEVSVDETETPTSPAEHFFIASELQRMGVRWVSLAPRYVGRFEKGVDYVGDTDRFASDFAQHVAVAKALGPYKLSLHSGSDKFSVYPIVSRLAGNLVHVKTAGTSYLEALRAVAGVNPPLFRAILALARQRYEEDKASYHVSACLSRVPVAEDLSDSDLPQLLDQFDARQVLHVTFGSVITATDAQGKYLLRNELLATLDHNEPLYCQTVRAHLGKHLSLLTGRE